MSESPLPPPQDYLKYWRVIRQFIKVKYKVTQSELDVLLFLYSERYFNKDKFKEFDKLLSWDENRFDKMLRDGWIVKFRDYNYATKERALYEISYKGKSLVASIYKKLSGEEFIATSPARNSMFLKNVGWADKQYREAIKEMNAYVRRQRHHVPE
jgi:hypothetical protein